MFASLKVKMESLSFYEANSPIYFVSKILGQTPYGFVTGVKKQKSLKLTIVNVLYAILFYGMYCGTLYIFIIDSIRCNYFERLPGISFYGHIMHIVIGFIMSIVCFLLSFIKVRALSRFIVEINKIDDELFELCGKQKINSSSFKYQTYICFWSIVMFCFVSGFDYYVFQGFYGNMSIVVVISYGIPYIMSACSAGQFIVGVHLIYERFVLINKLLNHIASINEPTSAAVKMHRLLFSNESDENTKFNPQQQPYSISGKVIQRKNESVSGNNTQYVKNSDEKFDSIDLTLSSELTLFQSKKLNNVNTSNSIKMKLNMDQNNVDNIKSFNRLFKSLFKCINKKQKDSQKKITEQMESQSYPLNLHLRMNELFSLHDKLCDVAEKFNNLYSLEMVTCITGGFVMSLFGFFFETKVIFWAQGINPQLFFFATSYILWGGLMSAIIYLVLRNCSNTREESCESALIIHKILQNKPAFMLNDEIYYSKMKSFTLQILQRKNIFHFHGLGLFRLDYTFIFSAVSAATSYLIVLLQFDMTSDFQKFLDNSNSTLAPVESH